MPTATLPCSPSPSSKIAPATALPCQRLTVADGSERVARGVQQRHGAAGVAHRLLHVVHLVAHHLHRRTHSPPSWPHLREPWSVCQPLSSGGMLYGRFRVVRQHVPPTCPAFLIFSSSARRNSSTCTPHTPRPGHTSHQIFCKDAAPSSSGSPSMPPAQPIGALSHGDPTALLGRPIRTHRLLDGVEE